MTRQSVRGVAEPATSGSDSAHLSRRGSISTLSSTAQGDREAFIQALDQIHHTASQSESLTAFNEFSPPPLSSSINESKGIAGDLVQHGLGGLYSKFRGAVEAVKEKAGTAVAFNEHQSSQVKDASASTSPKASSRSAVPRVGTIDVLTPSPAPSPSTGPRQQRAKTSVSTLASTTDSESNKISAVCHTPFATSTTSTAAGPAIAPVSVTARREGHGRDVDEGNKEHQSAVERINVLMRHDSLSSGNAATSKETRDATVSPSLYSHGDKTLPATFWSASSDSQHYQNEESDYKQNTDDQKMPERASTTSDAQRLTPNQTRTVQVDSHGQNEKRESAPVSLSADRQPSVLDRQQRDTLGLPLPGGDNKPLEPPPGTASTSSRNTQGGQDHSLAKDAVRRSPPPTKSTGISLLPGYSLSRASSFDGAEASPHEKSISFEATYRKSSGNSRTRFQRGTRPGTEVIVTNKDTIIASQQARGKVLSKDFWMRDENCKECFLCGDAFSTFRRRHHCRTCGQIFDAKCTSLISGSRFGHSGVLRLCKPCKDIIAENDYADEADSNDEMQTVTDATQGQGRGLGGHEPSHLTPSPGHGPNLSKDGASLATPLMAIPATRTGGPGSNRRSAILEIDADEISGRPGSSRSLKSSMGIKPFSSAHKRYRSRHQHSRSLRGIYEDGAPFQRITKEDNKAGSRLPAFHNDSIIDPDLAPYVSDEGSSADEQMSLSAAMNGDLGFPNHGDIEKAGVGHLLASARKGLSKLDGTSHDATNLMMRGLDDGSVFDPRPSNPSADLHSKGLVAASSVQARLPSKPSRSGNLLRTFGSALPDVLSGLTGSASESSSPRAVRTRMTRSASMRGTSAPPAELNNASLQHVRKLLCQLLRDTKIPNLDGWRRALMPILLQCTDDLNPDVRHGDDIDICHYVKIKRIPGGRPADTSYVSGVVFSKNLALKSMPRSISRPTVIIITFPIEYNRHRQHFMSLGPVLAQEKEYLTNLVNRIVALKPQLLLVQGNVSGLALQYLAQANVATAYNVKPAVLEAVSRCAQTDIISSVDMLVLKPVRIGECDGFDVKTYVHKDIPKKKKTYLYLSGCPPDLGCTIVLRGESMETLAYLKRITEFMVYVVYNLKLETCLMRDEFVLIPSVTNEGTLANGSGPNSNADRCSLNSVDAHLSNEPPKPAHPESVKATESPLQQLDEGHKALDGSVAVPDREAMPTFYGDMVEKHRTKILSASPFVKFMQPYLLMCARKQECRLACLKRLRDQVIAQEQMFNGKPTSQKFFLIQPEMVHRIAHDTPKKVLEVLHAVHDAEYDKALYIYETQKRQWETYIVGNIDLFDPYAHQNIVVLYSLVCTSTTIPCAGPDLLALAYYNEYVSVADFDADCTLGQFVEGLCLGANTICTANGCEKKMLDHHRSYVHGEARVSVFIEKMACKIRGLQDSILMWSYCKVCKKETQVMPMSESSWKYSFGKYLEISFWSSNLRLRAGVCPHDLHRDHLRYFGYKDFALRIHYDPIELLEIIVPRSQITWNVENDLRLKNNIYGNIEDRVNRFMVSVKARLKGISVDMIIPDQAEAFQLEIERLTKRANEDHSRLVRKVQKRYMNSKYYEIIPLNRALRAMQEKVAEWDVSFAEFEANFFPSEKDITRLAVAQMKRIFLDRDGSASSVNATEDEASASVSDTEDSQKGHTVDTDSGPPRPSQMSAEQAHEVLTAVVEEQSSLSKGSTKEASGLEDRHGLPGDEGKTSKVSSPGVRPPCSLHDEIRHLDPALPSAVSELGSVVVDHQDSESRQVSPLSTSRTQLEEVNQEEPDGPVAVDAGQNLVDSFETPMGGKPSKASSIPRPIEGFQRKKVTVSQPSLPTRSQPARQQGEQSYAVNQGPSAIATPSTIANHVSETNDASKVADTADGHSMEGRISERLGLDMSNSSSKPGRSNIPRSVPPRRKSSRVSNLAKHFEQLSREFEKERFRERQERAATTKRSRLQPMTTSKPIVKVYQNVQEAVEEREPFENEIPASNQTRSSTGLTSAGESDLTNSTMPTTTSHSPTEIFKEPEDQAETRTIEDKPDEVGETASDTESEDSGAELLLPDSSRAPSVAGDSDLLSQIDIRLGLQRHERSSLMKMLSNFWAERSASGWAPLDYPLGTSDHVFLDSDVIIREDEPSSLIAFALSSEDYKTKLLGIRQRGRDSNRDEGLGASERIARSLSNEEADAEGSLLRATGTHLKYQFQEGSAKMLCKIFYAEQFDAVRRKCGVASRIVESLSRCVKWDSKGGKTRSVFLKTLDERFVLKSLSQVETQAFLRFAPAYFQIMSEAFFHELPTVIAKMLGFYRIIIKNAATGTEIKWDVLIMENLFYDRTPTRIFDLKGSMRNRKIQSTGKQDEVLLDENMVEFIYESPLFVREHSKKLLRASVWNDTLFLARQNVMDYSLMIAVDEDRKELVVGIVDCIRTYTWDKKLESWIKDRGFAGGGKNKPTVTSPKEYKSRFREAMARYVLQAPNCWHQFQAQRIEGRVGLQKEDEGKTLGEERSEVEGDSSHAPSAVQG